MIRTATFFAALAINLSTVPALASECAAPNEIAASLKRWAAIRRQFVNTDNHGMACRLVAASFYESVAARQAAATCVRDAGRNPDVSALDSEVNAFDNLLSAKCGS
jgi:hypothetical protein